MAHVLRSSIVSFLKVDVPSTYPNRFGRRPRRTSLRSRDRILNPSTVYYRVVQILGLKLCVMGHKLPEKGQFSLYYNIMEDSQIFLRIS